MEPSLLDPEPEGVFGPDVAAFGREQQRHGLVVVVDSREILFGELRRIGHPVSQGDEAAPPPLAGKMCIRDSVMPVVHGALYYKAGLYADCSMQVYYVLAGLYGWIVWHNARQRNAQTAGTPEKAAAIGHTPLRRIPALAGVFLATHGALYLLLARFTDSTVPFWDSLTTALSIVAMWMLSRKYVEQWLVWLAADLVTVGLYLYKEIPWTCLLYTSNPSIFRAETS